MSKKWLHLTENYPCFSQTEPQIRRRLGSEVWEAFADAE